MVHTLPEEERHLLEMVEGFVATDLRPVAHVIDVEERIPEALLASVTRMDLWGLALPLATGGSERSTRTALMVVEELARGSAALAVLVTLHDVAAWVVGQAVPSHRTVADLHHGRTRATGIFPPLDRTGLWCHAHAPGEPHVLTGSTPPTPGTRAADTIVVAARCSAHGRDDLVLARVDADTTGVTVVGFPRSSASASVAARALPLGSGNSGRPDSALVGLRGSGTTSLLLEAVPLAPEGVLVDAPGAGLALAERARQRQRCGFAAVAVGLAQSGLDGARIHARTTTEAGVLLHAHESVAATISDLAEAVEATRSLQRSAADRADHGVGTTRLAAMARRHATRTAVDVITASLRLHGELGSATTIPMERLLRDAITLAGVVDTDRDLTAAIASSLVPA